MQRLKCMFMFGENGGTYIDYTVFAYQLLVYTINKNISMYESLNKSYVEIKRLYAYVDNASGNVCILYFFISARGI